MALEDIKSFVRAFLAELPNYIGQIDKWVSEGVRICTKAMYDNYMIVKWAVYLAVFIYLASRAYAWFKNKYYSKSISYPEIDKMKKEEIKYAWDKKGIRTFFSLQHWLPQLCILY